MSKWNLICDRARNYVSGEVGREFFSFEICCSSIFFRVSFINYGQSKLCFSICVKFVYIRV